MHTLYIINHNGSFTASNYPISENGVVAEKISVNEGDFKKALSPDWKITDIKNGSLTFVRDTAREQMKTAQEEREQSIAALKAKLNSENYTLADVANALKLIL